MTVTSSGPFFASLLIGLAVSAAGTPAWSAGPPSGQDTQVIVLEPEQSAPPPARTEGEPTEGESASEVVPLPGQGVNSREILGDLWFRHRALLQRGQTEEAARLVSAALAFMEREGLRAAPEIAASFFAEARRALEDGDYRTARDNYRLALRFEPSQAAGHFGLAGVLIRGDRDVFGAVREVWSGITVLLEDPEALYYLAGNGFLIVYAGLCWGGALALVLLSLHAAPAFFHDLRERFSGRLSEGGARLLGWSLLAVPIVLPLPPAWILVSWASLLFVYLKTSEKFVAGAVLVLFLMAGPAGSVLRWHFETAVDPAARALLQSARAGPDLQSESALKRIARERPGDPLFPFLLASAYRAAGHFDEAMAMYRRILEIDPRHVRAMVNLGNLHALRQEFALSQKYYHQAAEADPRMALAHYNSHLAHLEVFSLGAADEALKMARQIDDPLITRLLSRAGGADAKRVPQDTEYSRREIWDRAMGLRLPGDVRREVARALTTSTTLAGGAGLLAALLLPGIGLAPRGATARRCGRCGRAFCRRCQAVTKYPDYCTQCMHLFILRDGLAPNVKERKLAEVVRYKRQHFIGTRIFSLILPGGGHTVGGRPFLGASLLAAWLAAWIGLMARGRLLIFPGSVATAGGGIAYLPLLALALLAWLAANLTSPEASRE
jgi:tetratricopeptide (TPR) repeat protein